MPGLELKTSAYAIFIAIALSACAPLQQYRTQYDVCVSHTAAPSTRCESHALQQYEDTAVARDYLLGFIEFDDQGLLFDREQMAAVVKKINEEVMKQDLLMVVFVHGWKHSAAPQDANIKTFRNVLLGLSEAESRITQVTREPRREVVGVYLGWRGGSITAPWLEDLTFWDRKNTAHKVGHGGVTEVLTRLERIKQNSGSETTLTVVGHSFGGAAVYSALSQLLEARFVHTVDPQGTKVGVEGFGNLVVLINPAFEALQFAPLSDMSTERAPYLRSQLPVLAVLTSEADVATKWAFPVGRWFSTFFEKGRDTKRRNATTKRKEVIDEKKANITALGHFEPYRTHYLRATGLQQQVLTQQTAKESAQQFFDVGRAWRQDRPCSKIQFNGSILERTNTSAGRNPYLVVRVDPELIPSHNDISDRRIVEFVKQLILISSQTPEQTESIVSPQAN